MDKKRKGHYWTDGQRIQLFSAYKNGTKRECLADFHGVSITAISTQINKGRRLTEMSDKTFTYAEITAHAEAEIKAFMANAKKTGRVSQFHATAAWGVFWGWDRLTVDVQDPADVARLKALTETT